VGDSLQRPRGGRGDQEGLSTVRARPFPMTPRFGFYGGGGAHQKAKLVGIEMPDFARCVSVRRNIDFSIALYLTILKKCFCVGFCDSLSSRLVRFEQDMFRESGSS
jgi:hypothetical protein